MQNFSGVVQSGGTSRSETLTATVQLCEVGPDGIVHVSQTTTDGTGAFTFETDGSTDGVFYVKAIKGQVVLMALLGATLPATPIVVNELTTVAAVWCGAQFFLHEELHGAVRGMRLAANMTTNVVTLGSGEASPVLTHSPNAAETNALGLAYSLANLIAACLRDDSVRADLFQLTTVDPQQPPRTTLAAMINLARNPARGVGDVYLLTKASALYEPALRQQPDAWTLAVKVNDSGSDEQLFGGPGNLEFDQNGNAWILNNVTQGEPTSTEYSIVLDEIGRPARNAAGETMSPFTGGGLLGPGFGVALDTKQQVWIGDFGWGKDFPTGSVSVFNIADASPVSPDGGYQGGVYRVQGMAIDGDGNVWCASYGNHCVVVYLEGDGKRTAVYTGPEWFSPFDVAIAADGTGWVTNSDPDTSGIFNFRLDGDRLTLERSTIIGRTMKGIVIDSSETIWAASGGNHHVYAFDREGKVIGGYQGGGMDGPWGICLDGAENVWVGDFGPLEPGSIFTGRVTQLAGVNAAKERGVLLGDAMTPPSGYTLPSGGAEVLMHNLQPLYGPNGPACYIPMMRTTGLRVDAAGNVWTCNNWKPDFDIDTKGQNPGGDGMIIFLGVATPR